MKIIGGYLKGRNFYMPQGISPTQNVSRKAIFDLLGQDLEGVEFLELFAGGGSVGLEALSRHARKVTFVEKDLRCAAVIADNLSLLKIDKGEDDQLLYEIVTADAFWAIKNFHRQQAKFDVVFLDPPYGEGLAKKALKTLEAYDILHPKSFILVQHDKRETLPPQSGRFLLIRHRQYGNSGLTVYEGSDPS